MAFAPGLASILILLVPLPSIAEDSKWRRVGDPEAAPPHRCGSRMVYDAARSVAVLFGGTSCELNDGTSPPTITKKFGAIMFNDTWEWDGRTWREATPATNRPAPRLEHAMAYDANREVVVLFGGRTPSFGEGPMGDTWEWDGTNWIEFVPAGDVPPIRFGHAMIFDPSPARVVMYGGSQWGATLPLDHTWEWDGESWIDVTPPGANPGSKTYSGMVYDSAGSRIVLFGEDEMWTRVAMGPWVELPVSSPPLGRWRFSAAYDAAGSRIVQFGGLFWSPDEMVASSLETWEWDGAAWQEVETRRAPHAPSDAAMAYDSARSRIVLFGGSTGWEGYASETWEYGPVNGCGCRLPLSPGSGSELPFFVGLVVIGGVRFSRRRRCERCRRRAES